MSIARSSGEMTASAAASAKPCALAGVHLISDATNDVKVILNDHASSASGTVKGEYNLDVSLEGFTKHIVFPNPVDFANGIYVTLSGTGGTCVIEYILVG